MTQRRKESGIVFDHSNAVKVSVRLDGKVVGSIQQVSDGWRYVPKQTSQGKTTPVGDTFQTLDDCCTDVRGDYPAQHVNRR